eukprot:gnl/MRDRNA2_/MRDRNA2_75887_c0_seq1.p1 gnl/MRDRNA2_/MRDRNA2_75887_c0~~gnl/MRDRNA2_/MRDRNA2_75887_c0_seq1.p1  ORF type:complete len:318 (+),score=71.27 gnl/MRDRNA2_/MRDRNA2_75887_c0_seq1:66-1019(+)
MTGFMPDKSHPLADPLLQEEVPRNAHGSKEALLLPYVLFALGLAGNVGSLPRTWSRNSWQQITMNEVNAWPVLPSTAEESKVLASASSEIEGSKSGTIRAWQEGKGWGFIAPDSGGELIFCHQKDLVDCTVKDGDKVVFNIVFDQQKKKTAAAMVQLLSGEQAFKRAKERKPPPGIHPEGGDWPCKQCGNWNFAKRTVCQKCGAMPDKETIRKSAERNLPPTIDTTVGDWRCSGCGNWNWAKRVECNMCHQTKEGTLKVSGADTGTKREGSGGGFREIDESEEEDRRKRRATERAQAQERKAEKKKCPVCHRAACLC